MIASDTYVYPFKIVGTDLFHCNGQNFLVVVEFDRKYWEIERKHCAASVLVIWKMKMMFLRLGIPEVV